MSSQYTLLLEQSEAIRKNPIKILFDFYWFNPVRYLFIGSFKFCFAFEYTSGAIYLDKKSSTKTNKNRKIEISEIFSSLEWLGTSFFLSSAATFKNRFKESLNRFTQVF